ncbi:MAG: tyrosine-type recombinase/integrase [Bordetella sp.]|uniref:tyrosine-type recombinase/integrase n=1 Tax=Bordetella sp. TaxID=28081 RepID=UPI003F7C641D
MEKVKLTEGRISGAVCPEGKQQDFLWDSKTPGFGLRVSRTGRKSYIFQDKLAGETIRMPIGTPAALSLEAARKRANLYQTQINEGRDPRQVKAEQTAADLEKRQQSKRRNAPALEAWTAYIEARKGKWGARHVADHETLVREGGEKITRGRRLGVGATKEPGILRSLLMCPLSEITRDRVAAWLSAESVARAGAARRALACLGAFITWAANQPEYRQEVHRDACGGLSRELPAPGVKDDCLQREQLKLWFEAVRALPNRTVSAYLQILLLTGARRNELAGLRWEDVDFQWQSLTIRDKVEGERTIGMTPYVGALLRELKRINETPPNVRRLSGRAGDDKAWKPSPWVFASKTAADGRMKEPRIAHNKALTAAGLPALSIHGLRRSFGTLAEWVECPAGISAQIMGHKPSAIAEKHYRRRPLDLLRMWHGKIEAWMLEQAGVVLVPEQSGAEKLRVIA